MNRTLLMMAAAMTVGSTLGCSTTVRTMTARAWIAPPDGASSDAAPVAKNSAPSPDGAPAQEGAAPAQAPAAPGGIASRYYVTYWEGHCKPVFGCGAGESHVKRCQVNGDNTVTCVDEPVANKALNPE